MSSRRDDLVAYRREQRERVFLRSGGKCEVCLYAFGRLRNGYDVHHCYGRARNMRYVDKYERHNRLLFVCRACHRLIHDGLLRKSDVLAVLAKVNSIYADQDKA